MFHRSGRALLRDATLIASLVAAVFAPVAGALTVQLELVVDKLTGPVGIEHAGDGSGRLLIIEQVGRIRVVRNCALFNQPFLDATNRVNSNANEQGLLGLAFHPDFRSNGAFFIHYTDSAGDNVIERCLVSANNSNVADPGSCDIVFVTEQLFGNHNGGKLAFGPDGYLYISIGDGGGSGDPQDNAQDLGNHLGKILRIDVDGDDFPANPDLDYAVPPDNPFVGQPGADEIWAYGYRNPWRFSFDRITGDMWIGDVGQFSWEEIDFEPAGDPGGRNYGWDVLEGEHCFEDDPGGDGSCADFLAGGSTLPVLEYSSTGPTHCSVTGGFRYRGIAEPQLYGVYLYADFCSGTIWGTLPNCDGTVETRVLADTPVRISTFGEDEKGEIYVAEYTRTFQAARLHRVSVAPGSEGPQLTPTPAVLDYGTHQVGDMETLTAELSHTGTGADAVVIDAFGLTDDDHFQLDPTGGAEPCGPAPVCLAPGESCTIDVTFEPLREGGFVEHVNVLANSLPAPVALEATVPCTGPGDLVLSGQTMSTDTFFTACSSISTGPAFAVDDPASVELRAGGSISVGAGTTVAPGASLSLVIDPVLAQP